MAEATDVTAIVATELAKQIPVKEAYGDTLAPALNQTGKALEDFTKTIRLTLFPFQFAAAWQDRLAAFIDTSVRRVPEDRRVVPPKQIVGPTIEAIQYEDEGSSIEMMFSELLSKSMDSENVHLAHPSFPQIIRQLSSDEAKILNSIYRFQISGSPARRRYTMDLNRTPPPAWKNTKIEIDEMDRRSLTFPDNFDFYFQHLFSMGLAAVYKVDEKPIHVNGTQTGTRIFEEFRLTEFGESFMRAVSPADGAK